MTDNTYPQHAAPAAAEAPLLEVEGLRTLIGTSRGVVRAVDGVSLSLDRGESLGIVGESGSGKSVLARSLMGLLPPRTLRQGAIRFEGQDVLAMRKDQLEDLWGSRVSMVFQDPNRSLNPVVRVERQLTEGMRRHLGVSRSEARTRALSLLSEVGVPDPEKRLRAYPHELSGGMRQRVMIAIGLSCEPSLLIADEPTTALDVTVQRQILDLLRRIQRERGMGLILISHDLSVVAGRTDRVGVMYAGKLMEIGPSRQVFDGHLHRYTDALLGASPSAHHKSREHLRVIPGVLPDPTQPQPGCRFAPRCAAATSECTTSELALQQLGADHLVACIHPLNQEEVLTGGR